MCNHLTDFYEAALWVNCLEQAYSLFAGQYGKYGDGIRDGEDKKGRFDAIDGGFEGRCLPLFWGDDVAGHKVLDTTFTPLGQETDDSRALVKANKTVIKELIRLAKSQDRHSDKDVYISFSAQKKSIAPYIKFILEIQKAACLMKRKILKYWTMSIFD